MPTSTVTNVVDRLVNAGFLHRERGEVDRRQVILTMTDRCQQIIDRCQHNEFEERLTQVLASFTAAELRTVVRYFRALNDRRSTS